MNFLNIIFTNSDYFLQGLFNGLLIMMLLYNLFLFISTKDKSYSYYVLYVFFTIIATLQSYDLIHEFIFKAWSKQALNIFSIGMIVAYIFYLLLMRVFLGDKEKHPVLFKTITIILYFLVLTAPVLSVLIMIDIYLYDQVSKIISVLSYLPIIVVLVLMLLKGDKLARYFVYGSFALFAGIAYILLGLFLGYSPNQVLPGFQIGVVAQVFVFSMGLSYRYERMSVESIRSQHKALRNQIDPHFFFNSLSVLTSLVYKDPDKSADYVTQLSKVYRNILDKKKENLVPLEKELDLIESYIFLMKIRFGENISFKIKISDTGKQTTYIPPNTLQLLIENAVKHNKCTPEQPLVIEIFEDDDFIYVKNNVNKKKQLGESSGIGIDNISDRYKLLKGKKIIINEDEEYFEVVLPKFSVNKFQ